MIRVLIVESAPPSRQRLANKLLQDEQIRLVGDAADAEEACAQILKLDPDVVVLDAELPNTDGMTFLEHLTNHYPSRVVLYSEVTALRGEVAARAVAAGVSSVVSKAGVLSPQAQSGQELVAAVRGAAAAASAGRKHPSSTPAHSVRLASNAFDSSGRRVIAIGSSTGGTAAVEQLVRRLSADTPPVVLMQHLPNYLLSAFAERLNAVGDVKVEIARHGALLDEGTVVLAPGDAPLEVDRVGEHLRIQLGARLAPGLRPTVDTLFTSLARAAGAAAVGVLLSGSGRDGAAGLSALRAAGARTLVQDEATSAVWGMARAAIELGAAQEVLSLDDLCVRVAEFATRSRPTIAARG